MYKFFWFSLLLFGTEIDQPKTHTLNSDILRSKLITTNHPYDDDDDNQLNTNQFELSSNSEFQEFMHSWELPHYRVYFDWSKWENQIDTKIEEEQENEKHQIGDGLNFNKVKLERRTLTAQWPTSARAHSSRRLDEQKKIELRRQCDWQFNLKIHSTILAMYGQTYGRVVHGFVCEFRRHRNICLPVALTVDHLIHFGCSGNFRTETAKRIWANRLSSLLFFLRCTLFD